MLSEGETSLIISSVSVQKEDDLRFFASLRMTTCRKPKEESGVRELNSEGYRILR